MEIERLEVKGVDNRVIEELKTQGITELTPIQKLAIKKGIFKKKSMFIASPASSGKTLLSFITALSTCLREPKTKVLFLYPLQTQADEVEYLFKRKYVKLGLNFSRLSLSEPLDKLFTTNIIIGTFNEIDKILFINPSWLTDVKLIILDDFHLIGEHEKGGLLENLSIHLKKNFTEAQFLFLSTNIENSFALSDWLKIDLIEVYEPNVPLRFSVLPKGEGNTQLFEIIDNTIKKNGQIIVFTKNRSKALKLCSIIQKYFKSFIHQD
ncbi:MAG: DEAD/DEAH box helicase, partial [Candidatus Odinarchaeia archaeon]